MSPDETASVLLIASPDELSQAGRVWGTGGWMPPDEREALDWLTLVRLLGWDLAVVPRTAISRIGGFPPSRLRAIIVACDPDSLSDDLVEAIGTHLARSPVLVVSRAARPGSPLAAVAGTSRSGGRVDGESYQWCGPGPTRAWRLSSPLAGHALAIESPGATWARLGAAPLVFSRFTGRGVFATVSVHPSRLRDCDPSGTAIVKRLLTWGTPGATAWLDLGATVVLRMDDPGGAQNIYSRSWCYRKLDAAAWTSIGSVLAAERARMSIGYVSGWVDDGDERRGRLSVGGKPVSRRPGAVHPSPLVRYEDVAGHLPGVVSDCAAEFLGVQALRNAGLVDVELHGFTHIHPDREAWARASDRFESWPQTAWYRELGRAAVPVLDQLPEREHPLTRAMAMFSEFFGIVPTTLICPGDQWTDAALERALDLGLDLVSSYYLAIRHGDRFCWAMHVCAPYLDRADRRWTDSELPVVGYFHDRELAVEAVEWLGTWLARWREAGASRFIDFRELAQSLSRPLRLEQHDHALTLVVDAPACGWFDRPLRVRIRPIDTLPNRVTVKFADGQTDWVAVEALCDGTGLIAISGAPVTKRGSNLPCGRVDS
jgi:hypothetical protein